MNRNLAIETGCPDCVVSDVIETYITADWTDGWRPGATLTVDELA